MKVGQDIDVENANWTFGGSVPDRFVDHIRQSVPFYEAGHDLICQLSDFFCHDAGNCYELGVSTGELLRKLSEHNKSKCQIRWIGLDTEPAMIAKAKAHCRELENIELVCEDARGHQFEKADMIVAYYCMQFVTPRDRQQLFEKIYQSLNWGGAFIMFEKVRGPDARFQDILTSLYYEYKIKQGLTAEEILAKRASLKGILEPFSTAGNIGLLERAGFSDIMTIFKYICFEGFLAIK